MDLGVLADCTCPDYVYRQGNPITPEILQSRFEKVPEALSRLVGIGNITDNVVSYQFGGSEGEVHEVILSQGKDYAEILHPCKHILASVSLVLFHEGFDVVGFELSGAQTFDEYERVNVDGRIEAIVKESDCEEGYVRIGSTKMFWPEDLRG